MTLPQHHPPPSSVFSLAGLRVPHNEEVPLLVALDAVTRGDHALP